jgi:mannose-1-phosphate guanylyltransferase
MMMKDPIAQLREIENSILFMFEARAYIEEKSQSNRELLLRYQEAEKAVERDRKQIRYQRKTVRERECCHIAVI